MMGTRILLADDHRIMREGLKSMLREEPDMSVAGEAENGRQAIEMAEELAPDIVVMDIGMPDLNGIEATRRIVADTAGVKVIALSMHSDRRFVAEVLKAGASGYVLKDGAFEELAVAIRTVMAGQTFLSPRIADVVVEDYLRGMNRGTGMAPGVFAALTPREREVLQLLAEGKATKEAAACLHVSVKTVETHRRQIMSKLDIYSVAELTKYAIREGLTSLEV
jgi:DNA-binding NarL/FixJ family response regulator